MFQPTPYDINFHFLGFPIRIHPFFWLIIGLLGTNRVITDMAFFFIELVIWIAAAFVSILIHELGHALVFRHVYRVPSQIIFHGMGGMTVPFAQHSRRYGFFGLLCEVFLSAAGPLAGFVLAGCFIVLFALCALWTQYFNGSFFDNVNELSAPSLIVSFMQNVIVISIIWGIFNLLPIYPMDGGHISREIFSFFSPRNGVANSLILSMITAIFFALLALRFGQIFVTILFAYFAYQNYQELSFRSFRRR
ncbi:MAG: site-2 protease family protein [Planctomycetaceae bacterium]|jgi:Zn-dependent protease|nr:site-2 protease family protein [Planctomycetaceae bacterium]